MGGGLRALAGVAAGLTAFFCAAMFISYPAGGVTSIGAALSGPRGLPAALRGGVAGVLARPAPAPADIASGALSPLAPRGLLLPLPGLQPALLAASGGALVAEHILFLLLLAWWCRSALASRRRRRGGGGGGDDAATAATAAEPSRSLLKMRRLAERVKAHAGPESVLQWRDVKAASPATMGVEELEDGQAVSHVDGRGAIYRFKIKGDCLVNMYFTKAGAAEARTWQGNAHRLLLPGMPAARDRRCARAAR
jgi:hypothetical protein